MKRILLMLLVIWFDYPGVNAGEGAYDNVKKSKVQRLVSGDAQSLKAVSATDARSLKALSATKLSEAKLARQLARKQIALASQTRRKINKIRSSIRKMDKTQSTHLSERARVLMNEQVRLQTEGALNRSKSKILKEQARQLFMRGFSFGREQWVLNQKPLTASQQVATVFAHNTQLRSVHPGKVDKVADSVWNQKSQILNATLPEAHEMTLQIPALLNQNAPPDLDISAFQFSREEKLFGHIEVHDPANDGAQGTNVSSVPVNKMHKWRLVVSDLKGKPVSGVKVRVEGHMPGHVHGLPTQPKVTAELAPGVYLVEGMKFQMTGWWVIRFIMDQHLPASSAEPVASIHDSAKASDTITFNLAL